MSTTDYIGFPNHSDSYWNEVADLMFAIAEVDDHIDAEHAGSKSCDDTCMDLHAERREIVWHIVDMGLTLHDINLQVALIRHAKHHAHNNSTHHHTCTKCGKEL